MWSRVDGAAVSGHPFRLSAGSHTLTLSAPGYRDATQQVTVKKQQSLVWTPQLMRVTAAAGNVATAQRQPLATNRPGTVPRSTQATSRQSTPRIDS